MKKSGLLYCAAAVCCLLFTAMLLHNADSIFGGFSKSRDVEEATIPSSEIAKDKEENYSRGKQDSFEQNSRSPQDESGDISVFVTGAVKRPGVYNVPSGARVYQLLARAGGFTEDADKSAVNLAAKVRDGAQIDFPSCVETAQKGNRNYKSTKTSKQSSGDVKNSSSSRSRRTKSEDNPLGSLIDINSASEEELDTLPGVGAKTAALIVNYRNEHGKFERIEDLLDVKGIGTKKYAKLKDRITVGR